MIDLLSNNNALRSVITRATHFHRDMEKEFRGRVQKLTGSLLELTYQNSELNTVNYFSHNVFSILFISFLDILNFSSQRKLAYSLVTHLIRGIVTAADNILDNESKGTIQIASMKGCVVPNTCLILIQQSILHQLLDSLNPDPEIIQKIHQALFKAFIPIGKEECLEEEGVFNIITPELILSQVHHFRGGELLTLPFIIPGILEPDHHEALDGFRRGMYEIGMAVQALDDITDLTIDLRSNNHNLLASWIIHHCTDGTITDAYLRDLANISELDPVKTFPNATSAVVNLAINRALTGVALFYKQGYPVDQKNATKLIRQLFSIRNVNHLWKLYRADQV